MKVLPLVGVASVLLGLTVSAHGANILLVGGQNAPDNDFKAFLQGLGHLVQGPSTFAAAPPTASDLASIDLILVSRSANSGDYDDAITGGAEPALWNSINKPLLLMSQQIARGQTTATGARIWGWLGSDAVVTNQAAPTDFDSPYPQPAHPFVAGRTTNVFPAGVTIDYTNTLSVPSGAITVATLTQTTNAVPPVTNNFIGIVDYPAGTQMFFDAQGTQTTTTARRAFFHMWEYPDTPADAFSITANGGQIIDQIIDTLAPTTTQPGDVNLDGAANLTDYTIIRNNFQKTGQTRATGDLNLDGNVNFTDFRIWKTFRTGAGAGSTFEFGDPVPEPGSVVLALFAMFSVAAATGRCRTRQ